MTIKDLIRSIVLQLQISNNVTLVISRDYAEQLLKELRQAVHDREFLS
jgi:hypothetical protein